MQLRGLSIVISYSNEHEVRLPIVTCDLYKVPLRYLFTCKCISHDDVSTCHQVQSNFNFQVQKLLVPIPKENRKHNQDGLEQQTMHRTKYKLQKLRFELLLLIEITGDKVIMGSGSLAPKREVRV